VPYFKTFVGPLGRAQGWQVRPAPNCVQFAQLYMPETARRICRALLTDLVEAHPLPSTIIAPRRLGKRLARVTSLARMRPQAGV